MLYFVDTLRSLAVSMRNVFRAPTTVDFPRVRRPRSERYRASFALLHDEAGDELCVGCFACERICPSEVITVKAEKRVSEVTEKKRSYAVEFTLDANACIYCELCVQVCPTDAIVMTSVAAEPQFDRSSLCLDMGRLYDNERRMPLSWGNATKLVAMQAPPKKVVAKKAPPTEQAAGAAPSPPTALKPQGDVGRAAAAGEQGGEAPGGSPSDGSGSEASASEGKAVSDA